MLLQLYVSWINGHININSVAIPKSGGQSKCIVHCTTWTLIYNILKPEKYN